MVLCKIRAITLIILWVKVLICIYTIKSQWLVGFMDCVLLGMVDCLGTFCRNVYCPHFQRPNYSRSGFGCMPYSIRFYLGLDLDFWKYCNSFNSQSKQKVLGDMVLSDPALSLFKLLEYLPFNPYIAGIVVVICFVLFLTPVGSGTLMIANLSSKGAPVIVIHRSGYASFGLWSLPL